MFRLYSQTSTSGILKEVRDSEGEGRIEYSLAKDYPAMLDSQVREGTHTFIGEDLTIKVLIANDFSTVGTCGHRPGDTSDRHYCQ